VLILDYRYTPSQADVHAFKLVGSAPDPSSYPHVARWYNHIKSYATEHDSLPGSSKAGEAFAASSAAASATPAGDNDDDEVDLFGSDEEDDEETERVKAQRVAEYNAKKANKAKTIAKVIPHITRCMTVLKNTVCNSLSLRWT
jgi:elongation factor 1-beta